MSEHVEYESRFPKSKEVWEQLKAYLPGGVNHNIRRFGLPDIGLFPPAATGGNGKHLHTADGVDLVDHWMGHFALILGHSPPEVIQRAQKQMAEGNHLGIPNIYPLELAKLICETTPSIDGLRFQSTGTEATMYATRLARGYTKRRFVIKAAQGWHGGNDTLHECSGILEEGRYIVEAPFNDIDAFTALIRRYKGDLAAVIVEPMLGAGGGVPPAEGFLEELREETERSGALLIFDEVITGYRLGLNSGQGCFGVTPDITTLGKVVGGGAPIGVVGGRDDIMQTANPERHGYVWIGGGTFSGNPITMLMGAETLHFLKKHEDKVYPHINAVGNYLRNQIQDIIERKDAKALVLGMKSIVSLHWIKKTVANLSDPQELDAQNDPVSMAKHYRNMINRGMFTYHGIGSISFAHDKEDAQRVVTAFEDELNEEGQPRD